MLTQLSAEEHFQKGKELFDEENFLEAIEEFKLIGLQFSGSSVADDAQLSLGECYFHREEYLLAAYEFETLKKRMAASPLVPLAQYKLALCYYKLSPKSSLDQKYTNRAIDEFQTFIEYYPNHDSVVSASKKIQYLNSLLAEKEFNIARLYMSLEEYQSAQHYFEKILERYHDTKFAGLSQLGLVEAYIARNKFPLAKNMLDEFYKKYPSTEWKDKASEFQQEIEKNLNEIESQKSDSTLHSIKQ